MGGTKRLAEEHEANYQHGLAICLEAGSIIECEFHPGSYYDGGEGVEDALKLVESDEEREYVQIAFDDNSGIDYCPSCDRNMND